MKNILLASFATLIAATPQALAAPVLTCTAPADSEVAFTATADLTADAQLRDLTIQYGDSKIVAPSLLAGVTATAGELAGMLAFIADDDNAVVVPAGFAALKTPFQGYFAHTSDGMGGVSPVSCQIHY